jgi:hypothetical protein
MPGEGRAMNHLNFFFRTSRTLLTFRTFRLPDKFSNIAAINNEMENDKITADQLAQMIDLNNKLLSQAASTYAYNKINNILLMQVLAKVEGRDMEDIRNNVDRYIAQFADEFMKKNS